MPSVTSKMLLNNRLLIVLLLGFSSGLPLALTSSTLQAWFTNANSNIMAIGTLTLLGIPYTLKFLWAPLMDHYPIPFVGKRRGWILMMQLGLVIALLVIAQKDPIMNAWTMGIIALIIAFFSASQDIAVDAYRTEVLTAEERGLGASYYVFGYRVAMLVSGGLALVFADYFGWQATYQLMALLMLVFMLPTYKAPATVDVRSSETNVLATSIAALGDLLRREKALLILLFVVLYKFGDALAFSLMMTFLLKGLQFSLTEIGLAYKMVSFIAVILGGFIGGLLLVRWNIFRALLVFGLAQSFSNLTFAFLAVAGKHFFLMTACVFIENFCSGLSTAAFLAFLMSLCDIRYTASQYAVLSAIATSGRVLLGPVAALMVEHLGWIQFYIWSFILCFPSLMLLLLLKDKVLDYAPAPVR